MCGRFSCSTGSRERFPPLPSTLARLLFCPEGFLIGTDITAASERISYMALGTSSPSLGPGLPFFVDSAIWAIWPVDGYKPPYSDHSVAKGHCLHGDGCS